MKTLSQIHDMAIMNSLSRRNGNIVDVLNELITDKELADDFKYVLKEGTVVPTKSIRTEDIIVETIMTMEETIALNNLHGRVQSLLYTSTVETEEDISNLIASALEHDPKCQTDAFRHLDTYCVYDGCGTRLLVELNDGPEIYTYVEPSINIPRVQLDNIMGWITSFDSKPESTFVISNEDILNTFKIRLLTLNPNILDNIDELCIDIEDETISFYHNDGLLVVTLSDYAYTYLDRMLQVVIDWIDRVVVEVDK